MKVYVVNVGYCYEGESTVGVHASLEDGISHVEAKKTSGDSGDYCTIYEVELGSREEPKEVWNFKKYRWTAT